MVNDHTGYGDQSLQANTRETLWSPDFVGYESGNFLGGSC
jgi:hypothetical protein